MTNTAASHEIEHDLSKERQNLLNKLSSLFDPETAYDYVCPKTNESRQQLSLEELRRLNYSEHDEYLQRLRSLGHYKAATQSLSRADLEATYQSFVRGEVAQRSPRRELQKYVRTEEDIDFAKRYVDSANDALVNPQQSLLLFRSSKLNEQKANLLKSARYYNSLQHLNDDAGLQKYFSTTLHDSPKHPVQDEDNIFSDAQDATRPRSMHIAHKDKKYHVQFLKDFNQHNKMYRGRAATRSRAKDEFQAHTESLLGSDTSATQGTQSFDINTSDIHRETFPPLSLSALQEYRPSLMAHAVSSRKTSSTTTTSKTAKFQSRRKTLHKKDFSWNQSVVSSTTTYE